MEVTEREYNTILTALDLAEFTLNNALKVSKLDDGNFIIKIRSQLNDFKELKESLIRK